jgi:hypothetical protein
MRWKVSHAARRKKYRSPFYVLGVVRVVVVMTPVMSAMVVRRLRLRSHRGQQEQEQGSEKKLFHILRVPRAWIDATTL